MIDDYTYAGMDYIRDLELILPLRMQGGPQGKRIDQSTKKYFLTFEVYVMFFYSR